MSDFTIVPADSPDLMCHFTIPRAGKDALTFSVRRADYIKDLDVKWTKWLTDRMVPNEKDALGKDLPREDIADSEVIVEQLRLAGVSTAVCKDLYKLTNGELAQIFRHWNEMAKVTVGESKPSDS